MWGLQYIPKDWHSFNKRIYIHVTVFIKTLHFLDVLSPPIISLTNYCFILSFFFMKVWKLTMPRKTLWKQVENKIWISFVLVLNNIQKLFAINKKIKKVYKWKKNIQKIFQEKSIHQSKEYISTAKMYKYHP